MSFKTLVPAALGLSLAVAFFNCQNRSEHRPGLSQNQAAKSAQSAAADRSTGDDEAKPAEPTAEAEGFSTAAAVAGAGDSIKKFIRTADLKFQVRNAVAATLAVEQVAVANGGFVVESSLDDRRGHQKTTPVSRDSALQTTETELHSTVTLRVPFQKLDTALREIGRLATVFHHRKVTAEDVSLRFLENELARRALTDYQEDLSAKKLASGTAELERSRRIFDSQTNKDRARLDDLRMADAVRFSTVRVEMEQPREARQIVVGNTDGRAARAGLAFRLGESLRSGWLIMEDVFFGLLSLWPLILLAGGVVFFFKKRMSVA